MAGKEMITLKLRPGDQEKLRMALIRLSQRVETNKPVILMQAGHVGVSYCKIACPVITGRLRGSIGNPAKEGIFQIVPSGAGMGIMFGTAVDYAMAVEEGARPHIIEPGEKGFLAWKDKATGKYIYTKKPIQHPGFPGRHYMLRGVEQAVPPMIKILSGVIRG